MDTNQVAQDLNSIMWLAIVGFVMYAIIKLDILHPYHKKK
jgi:hypothetical protein